MESTLLLFGSVSHWVLVALLGQVVGFGGAFLALVHHRWYAFRFIATSFSLTTVGQKSI